MARAKLLILSAAAGIAYAGCFLIPEKEEELAPPILDAPEVTYDVKEVKRRNFVREIAVTGHLAPAVKKDLFFRYQGGRLVNLFVNLGDWVNKGDLLAEMNIGTMASQIKLREIAVQRAKIRYEMLKATNANRYELQMAELDIASAEILLQELRDQYDSMRLTAPISGLISAIDAKEGDYIDAFKVIMKIVDPRKLVLLCTGEQTKQFAVGMTVNVQIENADYEGRVLMTPLDYVDDTAETKNETMVVDVLQLPKNATMNKLGIASVTLERSLNTIVLRKEEIRQYGGRTFVSILKNGLKEERDVQLGIQTNTEVEIVKGLQEGDLVVTR